MKKSSKRSSILVSIINWNNSVATNRCLEGFLDVENCPDIILIDNHSTRETLSVDKHLLDNLPITLWYNVKNIGFAAAHNQSIKYAKEHGYKYICLLNNDTELINSMVFAELQNALQVNGARAVAPAILSSTKPPTVWYGGGVLDIQHAKNHHNYVNENYELIKSMPAQETSFITGCCVLIRTGGDIYLDESYFLYWEDADWSAKIISRGEKLLFYPPVSILHHTSTSLGSRSPKYAYYNIRNHILFTKKWSSNENYKKALYGVYWIAIKYGILALRSPSSLLMTAKYVARALRDGKKGVVGELKDVG